MNHTLLIVDDHELLRRSLYDWLSAEFPDSTVLEAVNGEDALAVARNRSPQIVVMDISLPGMNGIDAVRQLKTLLPGVKIIMLTIHEDAAYQARAIAAGADEYIPKARMQKEFLPALEHLLVCRT